MARSHKGILMENCTGLRRSSAAYLKEISLLEQKMVFSAPTCLLPSELTYIKFRPSGFCQDSPWGSRAGRPKQGPTPIITSKLHAECYLLIFSPTVNINMHSPLHTIF